MFPARRALDTLPFDGLCALPVIHIEGKSVKSLSLKVTALTVALLASGSVFADVQKSIHLTAEVAAALDLVNADGTPLPGSGAPFPMTYIPGVGLQPLVIPTRILTNDMTRNVLIRLGDSPTLSSATTPVPMQVQFDEVVLQAGVTRTLYADLIQYSANPSGSAWVGASKIWNITVSQRTPGALPSGSYTGMVSIILAQAT